MKNFLYLVLVFVALLAFLASCTEAVTQEGETAGESTETVNESSMVSVPVYLTDKRVSDVERVYIDISDVEYTYEASGDASTVNISTDLTNIDLLSLSGSEMKWFEMELPEGAEFKEIEFKVDSATAVVEGEELSIKVPSGKVKIIYTGMFAEGEDLVLDFDLSRSLVKTKKGYILKPVIKAFKRCRGEMDMYTISGEVKESGEPLIGAIVALLDESESTVVRSVYTRDEGKFKIRMIKEGTYTLNVYDIGVLPEGSELTEVDSVYSTKLYVDKDKEIDIEIGEKEEEDTYDIEGKVKINGEEASEMTVALLDEEGESVIDSTKTDDEGEFKFEDVKEGTYMLNVYDISELPEGSNLTEYEASYSTMLQVNEDIDLEINIENEVASSVENATVSISFTDMPALGIDHVYVHIDSITYHYEDDKGFHHPVYDMNEDIDIMSLIGEKFSAAELPVPSGAYLNSVDVKLSNVRVVVSGTTYPVSLTKSEVNIPINIEVNGEMGVTLDFDMMQSLFQESTGYSFNPVIKGMIEDPSEHKITGKVLASLGGVTTQPAPGFVVALFSGGKLFRLTLTRSDGNFKVFNVPDGNYTLKIYQPKILSPGQDITDLPLLKSIDVVVSSADLDVGEITVSVSF